MDREQFERLVEQALDGIPDELAAHVENLVVLVEDEPPPSDPDLLGLYEGTSLTEQAADGGPAGLPAQILVFRRPLQELCESEEELVTEVRTTVVHEVAHHFGIDDDRLHALGYG